MLFSSSQGSIPPVPKLNVASSILAARFRNKRFADRDLREPSHVGKSGSEGWKKW
jgi:hypothetical protein